MIVRDPEKNFEELWETFHNSYPFFELRNVDWKKQYVTYRPKVTGETSDNELFDIFCQMLEPLDDGHVELDARIADRQNGRGSEEAILHPGKNEQVLARIHEATDQ